MTSKCSMMASTTSPAMQASGSATTVAVRPSAADVKQDDELARKLQRRSAEVRGCRYCTLKDVVALAPSDPEVVLAVTL